MKALIIAIIITIAIVLGWYFTYISIEDITSQLINSLSELSESIKARQWKDADNMFSEIEEKWSRIRSKWVVILDHHEIDNIDLAIAKVSEYVKAQDFVLSLGEIEVLKKLFSIVKENEALTLPNIF